MYNDRKGLPLLKNKCCWNIESYTNTLKYYTIHPLVGDKVCVFGCLTSFIYTVACSAHTQFIRDMYPASKMYQHGKKRVILVSCFVLLCWAWLLSFFSSAKKWLIFFRSHTRPRRTEQAAGSNRRSFTLIDHITNTLHYSYQNFHLRILPSWKQTTFPKIAAAWNILTF